MTVYKKRNPLIRCCSVFILLFLLWLVTTLTPENSHTNIRQKTGRRHLLTLEDDWNCTEPGILDFMHVSLPGGTAGTLAISSAVILYLFLMLARICDGYFVSCIKVICYRWELSSDVAGATLMAGAMSSPDLFVNTVGTFLTEGDIGVGAVFGCGVVNMLAVPALCLLLSPAKTIKLDAWPVTRESLVYGCCIWLLAIALNDRLVTWDEALVFVVLYFFYIFFLCCDRMLREKVESLWDYWKHKGSSTSWPLLPKRGSEMAYGIEEELIQMDELNKSGKVSLKRWPMGSRWWGKLWWVINWPIEVLLAFTVPDCQLHSSPPMYALAFFMCLAWTALISYVVAWMITIAGYTLNIPDSLMGLTFIAIGMNVPEVASSVIVASQGHGTMALSNSLGSNTFDILICLGLPWLVKAAYFPSVEEGHYVEINSRGLGYSSYLLLATLLLLYTTLACNKFTINRTVGIICAVMYVFFAVTSALLEMNIFFVGNLPMCPVDRGT